jgi:hypothetical protein
MEAPTPRKSNQVRIRRGLVQRVVDFLTVDFEPMSKDDSDATGPRLDGGNPTCTVGAPDSPIASRLVHPIGGRLPPAAAERGFRYPSLCRLAGRQEAGCPSGQRERSVKPSAKPTLVRTQHLPPPAETAHDQRRRGQGLIMPGAVMCGRGRAYAGGCAQYVPKIAAGSVIEAVRPARGTGRLVWSLRGCAATADKRG